MIDSDERDALATKHERNREQRIAEIKRWVAYVEENPPDVWGTQLNELVDAQIEAAKASAHSADHYERVERAGRERAADDAE